MQQGFDPMVEVPEKLLIEPAGEAAGGGQAEDLKAKIAGKVRADAQEHAALTPADALLALAPDLPEGEISAALMEMVAEEDYRDIKAVTTASGLVFLYSEKYINVTEAAGKSLQEEVKFRIGQTVRADSRDSVSLTAVDALYVQLGWDTETSNPHALQEDARYADIRTVTASTGQVYFYSDVHMSANYALILARAAANDPCATIADTVRDASRIYPRPTNCQLFREKAFGINPDDLAATIAVIQQKPEYADIKKMVHPSTGAVYLYSDQFMGEEQAWEIMDWEEVGRLENP